MKRRKLLLEKKLNRLVGRGKELKARAEASTDVAEVRSIHAQLAELDTDIEEIREEIAIIDEELRADEQPAPEEREQVPEEAETRNSTVVGAFRTATATTEQRNHQPTETMEYRQAFMNFVQHGTPIPAELRAGNAIDTTDTQAAIPLTIVREIINTVRVRYGNLYRKVRKLAVKGGVEFPVGELEADFRWITEATVSPDQELDKLGKVSFGYHTAEIRIAQTFLSQILTVEDFEAKITEVIVTAYLKLCDIGIVAGSGDGQMTGIINDPRVTNVVTMTAEQFSDWTQWRKRLFAKIPLGYRDGEFIFPLSTVDSYLETMVDNNNRPIFSQATGLEVNDGDAMNPNGRFFGRDISLVEPTVLPDFDSAASGDVVGIFWQPQEYGINENFGFTMRRYFDEDRNKWINKALVVLDGKVLNPAGIWLIKKA